MAYAALFESPLAGLPTLEEHALATASGLLGGKQKLIKLPAHQPQPVPNFAPPSTGKWRDTNELPTTSVTENTTKLLESDPN
jgi:hypothetical protein